MAGFDVIVIGAGPGGSNAASVALDAGLSVVQVDKAEFPRVNLVRAYLSSADLSKINLARAILADATLSGANLRDAELARADLRGAVLAGADLTGANIHLVRLENTDLSQVVGLTQAQLDLACGDGSTKLPAGLERPGSWPCEGSGD